MLRLSSRFRIAIAVVFLAVQSAGRRPVAAVPSRYGAWPVAFEANRGQFDPRVAFSARAGGGRVFLTSEGASWSTGAARWRMQWLGARPSVPEGADPLPGFAHFFLGNDPSRWRTRVPTFARVAYRELWPGIDVAFHGDGRALEYDFVVSPDADPRAIRLAFDSRDAPEVDEDGDLLLRAGEATAIHRRPRAFEGDVGRAVAVRYVRRASGEVGFEVGARTRGDALVIDPVLAYATYLGGAGDDAVGGIAVDGSGSAYVAGSATSANFPVLGPVQAQWDGGHDVFVSKLTPSGAALEFSTYLGGDLDDYAQAIAIDVSGAAYVVGGTVSTNFPIVSAFQPTFHGVEDGYVAKLDPSGASLVFSTYLGGSLHDRSIAVAVDDAGSAYVAGETESTDFPVLNAYQSTNPTSGMLAATVTRFTPSGAALVFSTYFGEQGDFAYGVALDGAGDAEVVGFTSGILPTLNAAQPSYAGGGDAFAAGFGPTGSLLFSTFLGGTQTDFAQAVAVDGLGATYVAGYTNSSDFPVVNASQTTFGGVQDAWFAKLGPGGSPVLYATYLGGSGDDRAFGLALDGDGGAIVVGTTSSSDFPTTPDALQRGDSGASDAFLVISTGGGSQILYGTYLGGSVAQGGTAVAYAGAIYAGGWTASSDFPTPGALQPAYGGGTEDGWVLKLAPAPRDAGAFDAGAADAGTPDAGQGAPGDAGLDAGSMLPPLGIGCGCAEGAGPVVFFVVACGVALLRRRARSSASPT